MCGISAIQMTLGKTTECIFPNGTLNVECPKTSLVHRYDNGVLVKKKKKNRSEIFLKHSSE